METETLEMGISTDNANSDVRGWFERRAHGLIQRSGKGVFSRRIDAKDIRAEFRSIASAFNSADRRLLDMWFENRAEVFIRRAGKGWNRLEIDVDEVEAEFRVLAMEYAQMVSVAGRARQ